LAVSGGIMAASALLGTAYNIDQSTHQKRLASQKADAAKIDAASAEKRAAEIKDRNMTQAAMMAVARRQRTNQVTPSSGSLLQPAVSAAQGSLLGGSAGGKTLLGM
jgi:hypothetical protein